MLNTKLIDNLEKLSQPENYLWSANWVENWNRVAAKVKNHTHRSNYSLASLRKSSMKFWKSWRKVMVKITC